MVQIQAPRGIWRGDLTDGFLRYLLGGLIFGGAYTWRGLFSELFSTFCSQDKHCLNMMMICYSRNYTWPKQRKQLFALPQ